MKIQSLSVVVPAKKCVNDCMFCVSKMHESEHEDMMSHKNLYYDLYKKDYSNRLMFARDNGCNTVMLTGDCEPTQNRSFLAKFGDFNQALPDPFKVIEMQTAGNLLDSNMLYFLRHHVGVTTISLSVSDLWDDDNNCEIIGCDFFQLANLCREIKKYRFNLRLSLNVLDNIESHSIYDTFERAKRFGADQVTFRKMYLWDNVTDEGKWLDEHNVKPIFWDKLNAVVESHGKVIDRLEYGRTKYSILDMGVVIDDDCMSQEVNDVAKYVILRPNAKLYSKWETKASLIF